MAQKHKELFEWWFWWWQIESNIWSPLVVPIAFPPHLYMWAYSEIMGTWSTFTVVGQELNLFLSQLQNLFGITDTAFPLCANFYYNYFLWQTATVFGYNYTCNPSLSDLGFVFAAHDATLNKKTRSVGFSYKASRSANNDHFKPVSLFLTSFSIPYTHQLGSMKWTFRNPRQKETENFHCLTLFLKMGQTWIYLVIQNYSKGSKM